MNMLRELKSLLINRLNNQKGVVLPIILMALGGLSLIGAAAIGISTGEINIAHNDRNYKYALNMAEAGISDVVDAVEGNRDFMPRPLGAVNAASYAIHVAIGDIGRYDVTVTVPYIAQVTANIPLNASSVVVDNPNIFTPGDTVIIGDTTTHIVTRIGSIVGSTLNLADARGVAYTFGQPLPSGVYVAKNRLIITSRGQAGAGMTDAAATVAGWRNISNINSTPNSTSGNTGTVRATVSLQGTYSIQEIGLFQTFTANVNQGGSTFNGPMFVTNRLDISPYSSGDYSGPIFAPVSVITSSGNNSINIGNTNNYNPIANGPIAGYPKVIGVSNSAATRINLGNIISQVAASAACYQVQCGQASASQQIYYLDGYETDIFKSPLWTRGTPLIDIQSVTPGVLPPGQATTIYVTIYVAPNTTNNTQQYQWLWSTASIQNNGDPLPVNGQLLNIAAYPDTTGWPTGVSISGGNNLSMTSGSQGGYITLAITVTTPAGIDGGYLIGAQAQVGVNGPYDATMVGTAAPFSGVREYAQGINPNNIWMADSGANTHTGHATISTAVGTRQYIGKYATNDTTTATSNTWVNDPGGDTGAVMYGGKMVKTSTMAIGEQDVMYNTYYIHTNAVGNCNDHDIIIVAKTIVTYMGVAQRCGNETKMLFNYETVWNHTGTNPYNVGVQADDNDPKLTSHVHKGFYRWINTRDTNDNELMRVRSPLIGDKEFLSVFNHSANTNGDFHSAIVNVNISRLQMIGWTNPPIAYNSTTQSMTASVAAFPTGATGVTSGWLPNNAGSLNWDWSEIQGIYSGFKLTSTEGLDLSGFAINTADYNDGNIVPYRVNGNIVLPDMSQVPGTPVATTNPRTGTGNVPIHQWSNPGTWPGTWSSVAYNVTMPANPIMNAGSLPTTVITSTISGPNFTQFQINRGSANLFFDAANNIPFNVRTLSIQTRGGGGANITIGTTARPAAVYANTFTLSTDDCGGLINFSFVGKMTTTNVNMNNNVQYTMDTTLNPPNSCLTPPVQSLIYLKKDGWKEIR